MELDKAGIEWIEPKHRKIIFAGLTHYYYGCLYFSVRWNLRMIFGSIMDFRIMI